jgi:hypothetical protein
LSLDYLRSWADQWQLTTNTGKCAVLRIARETIRASCNYFIYGIQIPSRSLNIDLGFTIYDDMSFITHFFIVIKARQRTSTPVRFCSV